MKNLISGLLCNQCHKATGIAKVEFTAQSVVIHVNCEECNTGSFKDYSYEYLQKELAPEDQQLLLPAADAVAYDLKFMQDLKISFLEGAA